nr:rhomboid family intramembrane serine protease [Metabacillus mangrovi]
MVFLLPFKDAAYWFSEIDGFNSAILAGEWWRLVTPLFLHAGFSHLFFNTVSLILFAPALEQMLGRWKFSLLYLLAGVAGNAATLLLLPGSYSHVGASGAIFGLFGAYLFAAFFRKGKISPVNVQILSIIVALSFVTSLLSPSINLTAHLFGGVAGFALGPILFQKEAFVHYTYYSVASRSRSVSRTLPVWMVILFILAVIGVFYMFF